MEKLLAILQELQPDVDFETEDRLIEDKILSSIDIVSLIAEISDVFDVDVPPEELMPENFHSAQAIWAMIQRLDEEE